MITSCNHYQKITWNSNAFKSTKKVAATATESLETLLVMQRKHSMFMHCVPAMQKDLGTNVIAKVHSVVRNTLFKLAKFYPLPSHANKVVGICLYDCNFCLPGLKGDLL